MTGASAARVRLGLQPACPPVTVAGEPTVALVRDAAAAARAAGCDLVIACGGGSAIDAGKAIAALLGNGGDPLDYLEVVGRGRPLERPGLPFIAVPTTAGTGSEVTRNAVLASPEHQVKASLRSPLMLARAAVVDPDLLAGLPPAVIASSGLDALSQLIEPFVSLRANPFTDALAREGIRRSARSLRQAYQQAQHPPAEVGAGVAGAGLREDLALASLFGGLCLANAGLGAVHGFAAPIGGTWPAPHGATCAALLPHAMRVNLRALERRAPQHPARARFAELAALLTDRPDASADQGDDGGLGLIRYSVPPRDIGDGPQDDRDDVGSDAPRNSLCGSHGCFLHKIEDEAPSCSTLTASLLLERGNRSGAHASQG